MRLTGKNARALFASVAALGLFLVGAAEGRAQTNSRGLNVFLQNLTPSARVLADNSLRALSPAGRQAVGREYDALGQLNDFGPFGWGDARAATARICSDVLRYVPARGQQRFMNGVFGVSFNDKRFANGVLQEYSKIQQMNAETAIHISANSIELSRHAAETIHRALSGSRP